MELTQRLECTQELYITGSERICSDQVGFLGICGEKFPVVHGPNKIGRDPQTCQIVINRNSISRQHAVINVLSGKQYMLMDLGSANKTKLNNKALQPYIPYPLSNGDTIQFGEIFGIFRLLEEDNDLPMTQAIDIPETPICSRGVSRLNNAAITTVPESPEVSDRDDSFIIPSQPIQNHQFKSPSNKFIKPGKTISIQPVGTNKIDNVYWNSSKKSTSLTLDGSISSVNDSIISEDDSKTKILSNNNIHEMDTQLPYSSQNDGADSIYTAATQLPEEQNASTSIHNMNTQLPDSKLMELNLNAANKENDISIYNADTQIPFNKEPQCKKKINTTIFTAETQLPTVEDQISMKGEQEDNDDIFEAETQLPTSHKSKNSNDIYEAATQMPAFDKCDNDIFEAETQPPTLSKNGKDENIYEAATQLPCLQKGNVSDAESSNNLSNNMSKRDLDKSDDIILFDEFTSQSFLEEFDSQPLLANEDSPGDIPLSQSCIEDGDPIKQNKTGKRVNRIDSDSTDCEDIEKLPIQKTHAKAVDEDVTDCEDNDEIETNNLQNPNNFLDMDTQMFDDDDVLSKNLSNHTDQNPEVNFKDVTTKKIEESNKSTIESADCNFEDMATQIVKEVKSVTNIETHKTVEETSLEDMATQVIPKKEKNCNPLTSENTAEEADLEDMATQVIPIKKINFYSLASEDTAEKANLEDMATQVIPEKEIDFADITTQVIEENPRYNKNEINQFSEEIVSPFKKPNTPLRTKKKEYFKPIEKVSNPSSPVKVELGDEEQFYGNTQALYDDLCSQRELSPEIGSNRSSNANKAFHHVEVIDLDAEVVPSSVDGYKPGEKCLHLKNELSPKKSYEIADKSSGSSDGDEKIDRFVASLNTKQINEVIGVETEVANVKRAPSDLSDVDVTPKKVRPLKFMETELPDSQEIKISMSMSSKTLVTESSSDSEPEQNSEEHTPILFRKKKRATKEAKLDLSKKFESLPTRLLTRTRKPTAKILESNEDTKKLGKKILKPKFLGEEDDVDKEIITENITRLKTKNEKKTNKDTTTIDLTISDNIKETKANQDLLERSVTKNVKIDTNKDKNIVPKSTKKETKSSESILNDNNHSTSVVSEVNISTRTRRTCRQKDSKSDKKSSSPEKESTQNSKHNLKDNETKTIEKNMIKEKRDDQKKKDTLITAHEVKHTRSKVKRTGSDDNKKNDKKPVSSEKETKRKRGRPKKTESERKSDSSPERESTRSKRRQTTKTSTSKGDKSNESKLTTSGDQSTVYNVSSETNADSPRPMKRFAVINDEEPIPKRTRSNASNSSINISSASSSAVSSNVSSAVSFNVSSLRSTPARRMKTHYVLFTAFPAAEVKTKLEKLGAVIVSDVIHCTVLVTLQIKRTFKLLCAVGLGKPIVGSSWVQACNDNNTIVDPWLYLIQDEVSEKRFHFNLARTLAGKRNFLKGYSVSSTPSVLPSPPELKMIVECSGGKWQQGGAGQRGGRWVVVSCVADRALWPELRARGASVVSSEFILGGVLRQTLDIDGNLLK